jgi:hypothetical protein
VLSLIGGWCPWYRDELDAEHQVLKIYLVDEPVALRAVPLGLLDGAAV